MKEELEDNVRGNKEAISKLYELFSEQLEDVKAVNATQTGDDAINFLCGVDINYFC
jgi:hypothetical protein